MCNRKKKPIGSSISVKFSDDLYSSDFEKGYEIIAMYLSVSLSNIILNVVSYIFLLLYIIQDKLSLLLSTNYIALSPFYYGVYSLAEQKKLSLIE